MVQVKMQCYGWNEKFFAVLRKSGYVDTNVKIW